MNPFTTNEKKEGKYILPFQIQTDFGSNCGIFDCIKTRRINEILLPQGHSLDALWLCALNFENQIFFTLSASSTGVGGWKEVGGLNILVSSSIERSSVPWVNALRFDLNDFEISEVFKMIVDEEGFYSECGLQFLSNKGSIFRVAAGVAPGSMSIELPQEKKLFKPEFSVDEYKLVQV